MSLEEKSKDVQPDNIEAFVRDRERLLRDYPGKFVAYINGKLISVAETFDEVLKKIQGGNYKGVGVYIEKVDEEAFKKPQEVIMDSPQVIGWIKRH